MYLFFFLRFYPLIKQSRGFFSVLKNTFFLNDCQNIAFFGRVCVCVCCCQDQKVLSLSPLSAARNSCDSFASVSVTSVKCLGKARRREIFTRGALVFFSPAVFDSRITL